jgi:hypothetical protein
MNAGFSNLAFLKKQLLAKSASSDTRFDDLIAAIGLGVAGQFENSCNRKFNRQANCVECFPADHAEFIPERLPLESVSLVELKVRESDGWVTQTDPNFIRALNLENGIIDCGPGDAGPYYAQLRFTYTGGYFWEQLEPDDAAFPSPLPAGAAPLPAALSNAWLLQCRHIWGNLDKLGLDLLKSADVKSLRFPEDFAPTVEKTISEYIRYTLV